MSKTRVCSFRNCPTIVEGGTRCEKHPVVRRYKKYERTNTERGYGTAHRRWRNAVLERDFMCAVCGQKPSTDAHHMDGNTFNRTLANGQGLCRRCHNRITHGRVQVAAKKLKPEHPWFA